MDNNNLFSIGEIAKAIGITRKIILNYETKGLITPDKKDGTTGNRYYTIDTFTQIRTIRVFQDLGLSLDEIRTYFSDTTDLQPMINRLEKMRDEGDVEKVIGSVDSLIVYDKLRVTAPQAKRFSNGGSLDCERFGGKKETGLYNVYDPEGEYLGVGEIDENKTELSVRRVYVK